MPVKLMPVPTSDYLLQRFEEANYICHISLDLSSGELRADVSSVEEIAARGFVRYFPIAMMRGETVDALLERIVPLAERLLAGESIDQLTRELEREAQESGAVVYGIRTFLEELRDGEG